jgi:hypothetical protein
MRHLQGYKGKVILDRATNTYGGSRDLSPLILNLGTS